MNTKLNIQHVLPPVLPGCEFVQRFRDASGMVVAKLLPGDCYVTRDNEILDTVLGSCVTVCLHSPRLQVGGMNHFMLPRPSEAPVPLGADTWDGLQGHSLRYGSA